MKSYLCKAAGLSAITYLTAKTSHADASATPAAAHSVVPNYSNVCIIGGTANPALAQQICKYLGVKPANVDVTRFSDGEISVEIKESIRGKDTFIIQSCGMPVNDNILELFLTVTAARRSGASSVTAVVPYFGYRHNRRGKASGLPDIHL